MFLPPPNNILVIESCLACVLIGPSGSSIREFIVALKSKFNDLVIGTSIARPGPLNTVGVTYANRKAGKEPVVYDHELMRKYTEETLGCIVYQEQVMLLSQKIAGFTKGQADKLRKAMGKKQKDVLDKMKSKFIDQAVANGHDAEKLEKMLIDMG